jgi:tetratricopeptide (TPR) repeat protein
MWRNGDLDGGAERLDKALAVLADDEPDAEIAGLVEALARLRYFQGDPEGALTRVDRALEIAEALVAVPVLVDALNTKSLVLKGQGRHQEAQALLERSIALARANDASIPLLRSLNNYGVQLMARAEYRAARRNAEEALELARRMGHRDAEQQCFGLIGYLAWLLGDWDICREMRDQLTAPGAYPTYYRAAADIFLTLAQSDFASAHAALATIESLRESADAQLRSGYFQMESEILLADERYAELAASARTSHTVSREVHPQLNSALWARELAAAAGLGDADRLEELLREGEQLPKAERNLYVDAVASEFTARLHALRGEHEDAAAAFTAAAGHYRSLELPYELAIVLIGHGQFLADAGRTDEASPLYAEARAILERLGERLWLERLERIESAVPARL